MAGKGKGQGEIIGSIFAQFRISTQQLSQDISRAKTMMNQLTQGVRSVRINAVLNDNNVQEQLRQIQGLVQNQTMNVAVNANGINSTQNQITHVNQALNHLPSHTTVQVSAPGAVQATNQVNNLGGAMHDIRQRALGLKEALAGAFAAATGGAVAKFVNGIDEINASLRLMGDRLVVMSDGKIDTTAIDSLKQTVRDAYSTTGDDIKGITDNVQNLYFVLKDSKATDQAVNSIGKLAKVKGLDSKDMFDSYINFSKAFKNEDPTQVLNNFLNTIQKAPNVNDALESMKEFSVQMKDLGMNSAATGSFMVDAASKGWNTNKPFDALKETVNKLSQRNANVMAVTATAMASQNDKSIINTIQTSMHSMDQLNNEQKKIMVDFGARQHKSTQDVFTALRDNDAATVAAFYGRTNSIVQQFQDGKLSAEDYLKTVAGTFSKLDDMGKRNFLSGLGSQWEDIGIQGSQAIFDYYANLDQGVAAFTATSQIARDTVNVQYQDSLTAMDHLRNVWKDFISSPGMQELIANITAVFNSIINGIAVALQWIAKFVEAHQTIAQVIAYASMIIVAIIGVLVGLGAAITIVGGAINMMATAWGFLSPIIGFVGRIFTGLWGVLSKLGNLISWLVRFVIYDLFIPAVTVLAAILGLPVEAVIAIIAAIAAVGLFIWGFWDQIKALFDRIVDYVKDMGPKMLAVAKNVGIALIQGILYPIMQGGKLFGKLLDFFGLDNSIVEGINSFNSKLEGMKSDIKLGDVLAENKSKLKTMAKDTMSDFGARGNEIWNSTKKQFSGWFGGGKGDKVKGPAADQKAPDSPPAWDQQFNGSADKLAEAIKNAQAQATPANANAGPKGLTPDLTQPKPVQQTQYIYNPYDEKKVNNNLNSQKRTNDQAIGRRAVPSCGT